MDQGTFAPWKTKKQHEKKNREKKRRTQVLSANAQSYNLPKSTTAQHNTARHITYAACVASHFIVRGCCARVAGTAEHTAEQQA